MLPRGIRLGPYEILTPLGAGGMGEVFRARDTRLGRHVAVKILPEVVTSDPHRVARFEAEARALAALSHPNILAIHDFGRADGRLYAVTELLDGETLRDRMSDERLTWRKAADISAEIADGLASAHAAGIVHRDLKPENVFITSDGRVKILDFGLAKVRELISPDATTETSPAGGPVSVDGQVVGTLSYMAPEQLRGLRVDGRSDIFALGCVLFEMLSGRRPFSGPTPADTISAILGAEPPALGSAEGPIPSVLEGIVLRCLEKRPEDRFSSAHDLGLALRSVSADRGAATISPAGRSPARRWLAGALVAATALAALLILQSQPSTRAQGAAKGDSWSPPRQFTSAPGWEAEPAFSPDGTLVAYSSNESGHAEIWVVDPDGGEPLRLTNDRTANRKPSWFPDGRAVAFVSTRAGATSVWKVPRLGGSPTLLVEQADMPAISPDGTRIAFTRPGPSGAARVWVTPLGDPSGATRLTGDEDGNWDHLDPAWSPDGTALCYSDLRNLWLVPAAGGTATKLTRENATDREPVFSADGKSVFFSSARAAPQSVWRVGLDGRDLERITLGTGTANHPSLSRDGNRLVFSTLAVDRDVAVLDRRTGAVCRIASSRIDDAPALAPDGSAVAYLSNRGGKYDLWLESLESGCPAGKPPRRLTDLETGPATPVFAPDGEWVAFFRVVRDQRDIWAVSKSTGTLRVLVENPAQDLHPAYAPDGSRLAFVSNRSGREHIWILSLRAVQRAGEPWQLTDGDLQEMFPVWSPDGRQIAFLREEDVWVVEVRPGAAPRRITAHANAARAVWEPHGASLLVSGLFDGPALHIRLIDVASGGTEVLKPNLVLGDRDAPGSLSLSRDGRFLATDITEQKGNLWITRALRQER